MICLTLFTSDPILKPFSFFRGAQGSRAFSSSSKNNTDSQKRAAAALEGVGARRLSGLARSNTNQSDVAEVGGGLGGTSGVSKRTDRKCTLVLEDGSVFSGQV